MTRILKMFAALLMTPLATICADDLGLEARYWKALNEGREEVFHQD